MTKDPWTDPDPQPEDFDDFARSVDPSEIQVVEAGSDAKVTIVADAAGEEAKRLGRIARETDPPLEDVLADLRGAAKPNAAQALGHLASSGRLNRAVRPGCASVPTTHRNTGRRRRPHKEKLSQPRTARALARTATRNLS